MVILPEPPSDDGFENAISILDGLSVDEARMTANLDLLNGMVMSEAVMMGLAPHIGRKQAHDVVYEACAKCTDEGGTLRQVLLSDERINMRLSENEIDEMLDHANYLGCAKEMVDQVLFLVQKSK